MLKEFHLLVKNVSFVVFHLLVSQAYLSVLQQIVLLGVRTGCPIKLQFKTVTQNTSAYVEINILPFTVVSTLQLEWTPNADIQKSTYEQAGMTTTDQRPRSETSRQDTSFIVGMCVCLYWTFGKQHFNKRQTCLNTSTQN